MEKFKKFVVKNCGDVFNHKYYLYNFITDNVLFLVCVFLWFYIPLQDMPLEYYPFILLRQLIGFILCTACFLILPLLILAFVRFAKTLLATLSFPMFMVYYTKGNGSGIEEYLGYNTGALMLLLSIYGVFNTYAIYRGYLEAHKHNLRFWI